jgi:uncharacterized membrane protein YcaP (DUF421 family)
MQQSDIQLWDWKRILIGEAPVEFMLEVFVRTFVIFIILLFAMRILGKKMKAGSSILEMGVMIVLGALVAAPMQTPEKGFLPFLVILICIVIFRNGQSKLNVKYTRSEILIIGDVSLLVKDGILNLEELKKAAISRTILFSQLRSHNIISLGEVKRTYLESSGKFSIFKNEHSKPGLCVLPHDDHELYKEIRKSGEYLSCISCGYTDQSTNRKRKCPKCGSKKWDQSLVEV